MDIEFWDFLGIWCLEFDISEYLNTRDSISKDCLFIGDITVTFHLRFKGYKILISITLSTTRSNYQRLIHLSFDL